MGMRGHLSRLLDIYFQSASLPRGKKEVISNNRLKILKQAKTFTSKILSTIQSVICYLSLLLSFIKQDLHKIKMAKEKTIYVCSNCGQDSPKWQGKCPACGEWNTFVEEIVRKETTNRRPISGIGETYLE